MNPGTAYALLFVSWRYVAVMAKYCATSWGNEPGIPLFYPKTGDLLEACLWAPKV
jgi:hypothetical protein